MFIYSAFEVGVLVMTGAYLRVGVGKYLEACPASNFRRKAYKEIYRLRERAMYTMTPIIFTSSFIGISGRRESPTSR